MSRGDAGPNLCEGCEQGLCDGQGMGGGDAEDHSMGSDDDQGRSRGDAASGHDLCEGCEQGLCVDQGCRLGMRTGAADSKHGLGEGVDADHNTSRDTQPATLSPTTNGAVVRYVGIPLGNISVPVLTNYTPGIDQDRDQADADAASADECAREIASGYGQCEDQSMGSGDGHGQSDGQDMSRGDAASGHDLYEGCEQGQCDSQGMGGGNAEDQSMGSGDDDQGMSRGDAASEQSFCDDQGMGRIDATNRHTASEDQSMNKGADDLSMNMGSTASKQELGEDQSMYGSSTMKTMDSSSSMRETVRGSNSLVRSVEGSRDMVKTSGGSSSMEKTKGGSSSNVQSVRGGSSMAKASRSSSSTVRTRGGSSSEGCVQDVARLVPDDAVRVWRLARKLVTRKWGILKFCSDFLDDSVGWETNERDRIFTRRREAWKIRNMRFLNLKEGKKTSENQPQKDSVWQFWKKKSEDDNSSSKNSSTKTS